MLTLPLAESLLRFPTESQQSNHACNEFIADRLQAVGFEIEWLRFTDEFGVEKSCFVGKRDCVANPDRVGDRCEGKGGVAFLCHTDVVPAADWQTDICDPFMPVVLDGRLYGRGACDMKGSIAAAIQAIECIPAESQSAPIYFVCTADEEIGMRGARMVNEESRFFEEMVANDVVGIVGEPTELQVVHAHKGAVKLQILARGVSAHSSRADGVNANKKLLPILPLLHEMESRVAESSTYQNELFEPSGLSWNLILRNEPTAYNVTPSLAEAGIFLRLMPNVDHQPLLDELAEVAASLNLEFKVSETAEPWAVPHDAPWIQEMLRIGGGSKLAASTTPLAVCFATDASVLQRLKRLMVFGPGSIDQAHRNDEFIQVDELRRGADAFYRAFRHFCKADCPEERQQVLPTAQIAVTGVTNTGDAVPGAETQSNDGSTAEVASHAEVMTAPAKSGNATVEPTVAVEREKATGLNTTSELASTASTTGSSDTSPIDLVIVRPAVETDVSEILAMVKPYVEQRLLIRRTRAEIRSLIPNGFIAMIEDEVVGFSAVEIYSRKLSEIQCLAVSNKHQGKGIGLKLVEACIQRARDLGVMEVMAISSSDGFLTKAGFDYSLPNQKRVLFCQLRTREEVYAELAALPDDE